MIKIALTGATGNMGKETMAFLYQLPFVSQIRISVLPEDKKRGKKLLKLYPDKTEIIWGNLKEKETCERLIEGVTYCLHLAAVIPPKSDQNVQNAIDCNDTGSITLIDTMKEKNPEIRYVHISTVALYGNRNYKNPWARCGDPLLVSPYDPYAMTKLKSEKYCLESGLKYFAVIRQTAMLHKRMLTDNLADGLMFHTCFNSPLEWSTATDSGRLMANIVDYDYNHKLKGEFWRGIYNLGAPAENRITGFDTFDGGFKLIGGSVEKFFETNWNATRNFHGVWYYDGGILNDLFDYQKETVDDYWKEIARTHKYYSLARIVPSSWISFFAIKRLLKDKNSPTRWVKDGDVGRTNAYYGGKEAYDAIPKEWKDYPLLCKGVLPDGTKVNYEEFRDIKNAKLLDHGYDETKADGEITEEDLKKAATFRGGELVSSYHQDFYESLSWRCSEGHTFTASAFTVLKGGHWCDQCTKEFIWNFNKLAKKNKFYAQAWYLSHDESETMEYAYDEQFHAVYKSDGE